MAVEMRAFCDNVVAKFQQGKDLMSVKDFVKLHRNLPISAAAAAAIGNRNDVRTIPVVGGSVTAGEGDITDNIFADPTLHADAASTLASLSQQRSGFTGSMPPGEAEARFQAYLDDFSAVHWDMANYQYQHVHHDSENHSQFVEDLVATVLQPLQSIYADESTINSVSAAIRQLASTVSNSSGNSTVEATLYNTFSISRNTNDDPVFYGFFFTVLDMDHQAGKKSNVITSDADTYTYLYKLNSPLLVQYADLYNTLIKSSVADWISSHSF